MYVAYDASFFVVTYLFLLLYLVYFPFGASTGTGVADDTDDTTPSLVASSARFSAQ